MKFGEIQVSQIVDNEFRIAVLEKLLDTIISKNPNMTVPSVQEFQALREEVLKTLRTKYPNSGIEYNR